MAKLNISEITVNVTNFQAAYTDLELGTVSPDKTISSVVTSIETILLSKLAANWPSSFKPITPYQSDSAILTLMNRYVSGVIPQCVIDAITSNFKIWKIAAQTSVIEKMAKEISLKVSTHTETTGILYGQCLINENESIQWGVAFTSATVVDDPKQKGVIYGFTAEYAKTLERKKCTVPSNETVNDSNYYLRHTCL